MTKVMFYGDEIVGYENNILCSRVSDRDGAMFVTAAQLAQVCFNPEVNKQTDNNNCSLF